MTPAARPPALGRRLAASIARHFTTARSPHSNVISAKAGTHDTSPPLDTADHSRPNPSADATWASEAPSKKSSATGPLIAFQSLRQPVWTPRDYTAFAREGFMQNAIVYRCVRMIAECAGAVPLLLYAGRDELDDHPLLDLVRRPNPAQVGPDLIEALVGHLLVAGNAYVEAVTADGDVRELTPCAPIA